MTQVTILKGTYRGQTVKNTTFELVKDYVEGARGGFVTVKSAGHFGPEFDVVRVRVDSIDDVVVAGSTLAGSVKEALKPSAPVETDEEVMKRIETRFGILDEMTKAAINGDVRAMIVQGPPGVGKSYGVQYQLEKSGIFDKVSGKKIKYEIIKGSITPVGLYCLLYNHSDEKNVLVFDDCDVILFDDLSLNILKAALDSGKKRRINWNADSRTLKEEGVPNSFEFKGSVIFITNLKFDNVKSKKLQDHLEALQSRCHFLDLTLNTMRDKFLRIKQIFRKGDLFQDYHFDEQVGEEILNFMYANKDRLREMSLRMALKLADLTNVNKTNWRALAESTCMRNA
jgi:hypothetical protein